MADERTLAEKIEIVPIRAEMATLRAATLKDCDKLEALGAFSRSVDTYGNLASAQRAIVRAWVERSTQWQNGLRTSSDIRLDAQDRGVMAWTICAQDNEENTSDETGESKQKTADEEVIGMIFLVDIDAWNSSARIQVVFGENYRGRGYTRDIMPRVMTYGFAPAPAGLGLHRIWMSVPSSNSRSLAVFQSIGFTQTGVSRDAVWNPFEERYSDVHILDALVDEFDPIQSLETFGLHAIMENPGIKEALAQHEHTAQLRLRTFDENGGAAENQSASDPNLTSQLDNKHMRTQETHISLGEDENQLARESMPTLDKPSPTPQTEVEQVNDDQEHLPWWRMLGANRKRK